jgi:predicted phage terminase large subunit-like protein
MTQPPASLNLRTLDTAVSSLGSSLAARWRAEAAAIRSGWSPQAPTDVQRRFLELDCREALYGGAAGGGKSSALLMGALQYVDVPGYAALLFRRTYADLALPGALMDRAEQWLRPTPAKWNANDRSWTFPSGATLTFGYLETEADKYRYQGAEAQFIGFDELTQFSETQYRYLFSRLRRLATSTIPLRMRAATNPGGSGHAWVHQRFIVEGAAHGRVFIPARLDDNPHLDREEYLASLSELDEVTRQQLELGSWDALAEGTKFKREWWTEYPGRIVTDAPLRLDRVRYWDLASTEPRLKRGRMTDPDWTVGALLGRQAGLYYVLDLQRLRGTPLDVETRIKATAKADTRLVPVYIEQEPGSNADIAMDHYRRRVLDGYDFHAIRATGSKELRANPLSAAAQAGNLRIVRADWLTALLDELCAFPNGDHDDQVDAVSGAYTQLAARARRRAYNGAVGPPRPPLPRFVAD